VDQPSPAKQPAELLRAELKFVASMWSAAEPSARMTALLELEHLKYWLSIAEEKLDSLARASQPDSSLQGDCR
jgi:hypothetical protein